MKLLVTGAAGHVATLALPGLAGHELRLTDARTPARMPDGASFQALDLLRASDAELAALMGGVEVVVHSAYVPSGQPEVYSVEPPQIERFDAELDNIRMAQRIYRAALDAGVRRVVAVSSNHAADWYEHYEVHRREREVVSPADLPLSDNFYGWAKASYELLAHPYACGAFGRRVEMVMLRIGSPYPIDPARYAPGAPPIASSLPRPRGAAAFKRALGAWLSDRDCASLFRCAVEARTLVAAGEVPWVVAYGISDNTRAFWSLESARRHLGYAPEDDSEVVHADAVRRLLTSGATGAAGRLGPAAG
jgi:nucleoside-diphosphate-sugar epimerase